MAARKIPVETPGDENGNEGAAQAAPAPSANDKGTFSPKVSEPWSAQDESETAVRPDAIDAEMEELMAEEAAKASDEELAQARREAAEAKDRYARLQAEWDNFRKRNAAERDSERARSNERLVKDILPVLDDLERAIIHAGDAADPQALKAGVEAVYAKLQNTLERHDVVLIDPQGEAFDANKHQAIGTAEDTNVYDETVTQVYQKGYEMGGHILRPAMVIVSTGGDPRPAEDCEAVPENGQEPAGDGAE